MSVRLTMASAVGRRLTVKTTERVLRTCGQRVVPECRASFNARCLHASTLQCADQLRVKARAVNSSRTSPADTDTSPSHSPHSTTEPSSSSSSSVNTLRTSPVDISSAPAVPPTTSKPLPTHIHNYPITVSPLSLSDHPTFHDLHVSSHIQHKLAAAGIRTPTAVQCATIPYLTHHPSILPHSTHSPDLILTDEPGRGKTLAYLVPLLSELNPYLHALQAVVIVPTRALAVQVTKVLDELNRGGSKARQRNPLRVDLAKGRVNPAMIAAITQPHKPRTLPRLPTNNNNKAQQRSSGRQDEDDEEDEWQEEGEEREAGVPVGRVEVPSDFQAEHETDPLLSGSGVPQVLIGTPEAVHELLVKRGLLDCRELRYIVVDDADAIVDLYAAELGEIVSLRSNNPQLLSNSQQSLPTPSHSSSIILSTTPKPASAPPHPERPPTQAVLVSSIVTVSMLAWASRNLSRNRLLLSPASVPTLVNQRRITLLSEPSTAQVKGGKKSAVLKQQLHLPATINHFYALYPPSAESRKGEMLLQLLLAIRSHQLAASPVVKQPQWVRHVGSKLKGGMQSVPPLSDRLPQTTLVILPYAEQAFPLMSLLSSHFRLASLVSSSRTELRDALSVSPPPEVILAVDGAITGLDLKTVSHVINYSVYKMSRTRYYRRAGRCGRLGAVWSNGSVITMCRDKDEVSWLEQLVSDMRGRRLARVVVRHGQLYEREHKSVLIDQTAKDRQSLSADVNASNGTSTEQKRNAHERKNGQAEHSPELPPVRYLDSLFKRVGR